MNATTFHHYVAILRRDRHRATEPFGSSGNSAIHLCDGAADFAKPAFLVSWQSSAMPAAGMRAASVPQELISTLSGNLEPKVDPRSMPIVEMEICFATKLNSSFAAHRTQC